MNGVTMLIWRPELQRKVKHLFLSESQVTIKKNMQWQF